MFLSLKSVWEYSSWRVNASTINLFIALFMSQNTRAGNKKRCLNDECLSGLQSSTWYLYRYHFTTWFTDIYINLYRHYSYYMICTCIESPCLQYIGLSTTWASTPGRTGDLAMGVSPRHVVRFPLLISRERLWRNTWKWQTPSMTSKSHVITDSASVTVNKTLKRKENIFLTGTCQGWNCVLKISISLISLITITCIIVWMKTFSFQNSKKRTLKLILLNILTSCGEPLTTFAVWYKSVSNQFDSVSDASPMLSYL